MTAGVGYGLLSLAAAGVLDVVFARYSGGRRVTWVYLAAMGATLFAGQSLVLALSRVPVVFDITTALGGIVAGGVLMLANALLIESLGRMNVSLGSTIYRLNTIAVVAFAVAFLSEALTWRKLSGVAFGVIAVMLLYRRGGREGDDRRLVTALWIAISASLLRAAFGIFSKVGLTGGIDPFVFLVYVGAGWTLTAIAYGIVRGRSPVPVREILPYAILSGVLACFVASFLLLGLRTGEASIVIPIANMSFVVALLTSAALSMERLTRQKLLAVGSAALAIVLLVRA